MEKYCVYLIDGLIELFETEEEAQAYMDKSGKTFYKESYASMGEVHVDFIEITENN